jgi:hypothetical protein
LKEKGGRRHCGEAKALWFRRGRNGMGLSARPKRKTYDHLHKLHINQYIARAKWWAYIKRSAYTAQIHNTLPYTQKHARTHLCLGIFLSFGKKASFMGAHGCKYTLVVCVDVPAGVACLCVRCICEQFDRVRGESRQQQKHIREGIGSVACRFFATMLCSGTRKRGLSRKAAVCVFKADQSQITVCYSSSALFSE